MGYHPISDLLYTLSSQIPMDTSSALDKAEKCCKKVIAGATDIENIFDVSLLISKGYMYAAKIPVTRKKSQHGIA